MANIGLKYIVTAPLTESGTTCTYGTGAVLAKALTAKINISTNDAKLYADDALAESDNSFVSGKLNLGIDDLYDAAKVALLAYIEGTTIDVSLAAKELTAAGLSTPYVGVGFYAKVKRNGSDRWRAIFLKKVQFSEPNTDFETQGEKVTFKTSELEGNIMMPVDGRYKNECTFDTEAEAVTYLNTKANITTSASNNITALTTTGGTLTPSFSQSTYNYSCSCTGNLTLTATFAAGTAKVYIDGTYSQTLTTATAGTAIVLVSGDSKLVQIIVQEVGKTPKTYNFMVTR